EHPMLMKLAVWGSVDASEAWNRFADRHGWERIPAETALRLPNALVGTATTVVVFLVADVLFGNLVALGASALWALDVNATAINRIGKEDTFLLFFFLLAIWLYERGKQRGGSDPRGAQRWFTGSGASFGLMLASKYMPHYLGVYALFNTITDLQPGANRPHKGRFYGAMALAFVAANVAILMPATWQ
ncbi:MAG: glycosyltransferase family 39 protein, partial [Acidobacteria bacterium]|nr:glycosyltransferase family 39 protein [Acidobacteriota bacterium]